MRSVEPHVLASSEYFNFSPSALARTYLLHVLCVGEFTYEPGYDLRRSAFDSLLLEIILDGRVNLETEGETLAARAGQVVLIDCTKPHRYWSDTGWHALWVHFDGAAARGYFQMILRQNGRVFATHRQRSVFDALQAVVDNILDERVNQPYTAVFLETAYIRAMVLPELGGRIQRALDKRLP